MKTRLLMIAIVFFLSFVQIAYGHTIPMTRQDVLDGFDLIVLGTITDVKIAEGKVPLFTINVEETVKPDSFESQYVLAAGCDPNSGIAGVPCPSFEVGQRGLFLLSSSGDRYDVAFNSQVAEPHCTSEQFLANYKGMQSIPLWTQSGESYWLFTGKPVGMHYTIHNQNMTERDYSVSFTAYTNGFSFSDVVNGTLHECEGFADVATSFVPTIMGTYGHMIKTDNGGSGGSGIAIIDYGSTPLEQTNAGIHAQDTWCRDGYILVLRHDDTPQYVFDNKPACVKPDTISKMAERGIIDITSFYHSRPLVERLYVGMTILKLSDIPVTVMGPTDDDQVLKILIDKEELNKIPNAQDYFEKTIRETIPFDVPLEITFDKFWE